MNATRHCRHWNGILRKIVGYKESLRRWWQIVPCWFPLWWGLDTQGCVFIWFNFHWAHMLWKQFVRYTLFNTKLLLDCRQAHHSDSQGRIQLWCIGWGLTEKRFIIHVKCAHISCIGITVVIYLRVNLMRAPYDTVNLSNYSKQYRQAETMLHQSRSETSDWSPLS